MDQQRSFNPSYLNAGHPNLLVTPPGIHIINNVYIVRVTYYPLLFLDDVLSSVLALYTEDHTLPLPTQEEVLLCTCRTTTEEVGLFIEITVGAM